MPFIISIFLVGISLYIRLRMKESPIFQQIKSAGMTSAQPLKEAFTQWENLKRVLISLFGATAGQGVVWYTGQFYALFYLQTILKVNGRSANYIIAIALLLGDAVLCFLWSAFGSHRTQVDHDGWMFARGGFLHSDLPRDAARCGLERCDRDFTAKSRSPARSVLTPQTMVNGALQPAKEVLPYTNFGSFISQSDRLETDPAGVYSGDFCDDGLWSNRGLSGRGISGKDQVHGAVACRITSATACLVAYCR